MKYCFDFKTQMIYGIVAFIFALIIIYLLTKEVNWIVSIITGVFNFIISGYYTKSK
jgi:hypothetical protein